MESASMTLLDRNMLLSSNSNIVQYMYQTCIHRKEALERNNINNKTSRKIVSKINMKTMKIHQDKQVDHQQQQHEHDHDDQQEEQHQQNDHDNKQEEQQTDKHTYLLFKLFAY